MKDGDSRLREQQEHSCDTNAWPWIRRWIVTRTCYFAQTVKLHHLQKWIKCVLLGIAISAFNTYSVQLDIQTLQRFSPFTLFKATVLIPTSAFCQGFFSFAVIPRCLAWHDPVWQEHCPLTPSWSLPYQNALAQGSLGCRGISLAVLRGNKWVGVLLLANKRRLTKVRGLSYSRNQHKVFCPSFTVFLVHCRKRGRTVAGPNNIVLGSGFCSRTEQGQSAIQVPILLICNLCTWRNRICRFFLSARVAFCVSVTVSWWWFWRWTWQNADFPVADV